MTPDVATAFLTKVRERLSDLHRRAATAVERLSDAEVNWRSDSANNSIANLVVHMSGNIRQRLGTEIGGVPFERNRDAEFSLNVSLTAQEALAELNDAFAFGDRVLADLSPERIFAIGRIRHHELTFIELILHTSHHLAEHTGQILYMAKQLKGKKWEILSIPHRQI